MPDRSPSDRMLWRLLRQLSSTFWVSVFLTFSVNASIGSFWAIFVPSETRLDHRFVLIIIFVLVIIIGAAVEVARRALVEADTQAALAATYRIPIPVVRSGAVYQETTFIIVGEADALTNDTAVAIYQSVNGFEFEIGIGRVNRIAQSDAVQIEIVDTRGRPDIWERVGANEAGLLSTLRVRSALPFTAYQGRVSHE